MRGILLTGRPVISRRGELIGVLIAAAVAMVPARTARAAVTDYVGRTVVEVRLELEGSELREPAILDVITTRTGQPLNMSEVRETITHLFGFGRYEDIQVRASAVPGGVAVVYDLVPIHRVRTVEFRGMLALSTSELRSAVTDRLGPVPPAGRAADAVRILEDLYRDHGYRHPTIRSRAVTQHNPDATTMIFEIQPGERTRIGNVAVEGTTIPELLINRLNTRTGQPFEAQALVTALGRYRAELQRKGHYEARANYLPRYSNDELTVDLTILIEEGPIVAVRFEGDPLADRERDQLVPIVREQSVDEDLLEDSKLRIENRLKSQGYRNARADYRRVESDGMLTVVFTVSRGPQYRLGAVDFLGNSSLTTAQLHMLLRLKEAAPFADSILAADVAGMADLYRRQGFADVKLDPIVLPAENVTGPDRLVAVRINVSEGVRTLIRDVTFTGNQSIPESTLRKVAGLNAGQPFYDPQTQTATEAVQIEYLNRGYQNASVERTITWSDDRRQIDVAFRLQEGEQVLVDQILIVGNTRTASAIIERELALKPGEPLGQEAVIQSQQRLGALGLFRRVEITELRHPGEGRRRDVLVTIQEAPSTTIGWGGGFEGGKLRLSPGAAGVAEERIEFAPHGFFDIGRRNLWGKNRSVDLFARVSFRPRGESTAAATPAPDGGARYGFNEYRVLLNYREPKVLDTSADGLITGYIEQGIRSSFNFIRRGTRLEAARRVSASTSVSGRYSLDHTRLVDERLKPDEQPIIDRAFPQVRLSAFASSLIRSTRDDPLDPTRGTLLTVDGSLAARRFGSEVGFLKTLVKGSTYHQLTNTSRVVFAGAATLGLAHGLPRQVTLPDGSRSEIEDLPASERFFAGGDTTVRGFALDRLGRPDTFDNFGFPKGGHALVIFNSELRVSAWRALEAVGFVDTGNVFAKINDLNLLQLRGGTGFGVRYRSPVGPVRVDLGFKLSRLDFQGRKEPLTALHISLGQAF